VSLDNYVSQKAARFKHRLLRWRAGRIILA